MTMTWWLIIGAGVALLVFAAIYWGGKLNKRFYVEDNKCVASPEEQKECRHYVPGSRCLRRHKGECQRKTGKWG